MGLRITVRAAAEGRRTVILVVYLPLQAPSLIWLASSAFHRTAVRFDWFGKLAGLNYRFLFGKRGFIAFGKLLYQRLELGERLVVFAEPLKRLGFLVMRAGNFVAFLEIVYDLVEFRGCALHIAFAEIALADPILRVVGHFA